MAVSILLPRNNLQCDKCVAYIAYVFVLGTCTSLHHEFHCPYQYYKAFKRSDVFVCVFQYSLNSIIQITKQEVKDRYEEEIERYIYACLLS